ncbi:hypothetical protein VTO42DRAFT_4440 [Malbranchea cinnamomea]
MSTAVHTVASISSQLGHPLHRSFIADNEADTHVVNRYHRHHFQDFCPAKPGLVLLHGNTSTPIQGFGTAYFVAKDLSGKSHKHYIHDVAYVPDFHLNIVSLTRAADTNIGFNTLTGHLFSGDEILATTERIERQFVLEYVPNPSEQPLLSAFTTKTSAKRPESSASFDRWRSRLGWPSRDSILRLPSAATDGVDISDLSDVKKSVSSDPPALNESYELANPKRLVSHRHLSQPPTRPFQDVWVDIIHESTPGFDDINDCIPHFFELLPLVLSLQ